MILYLFIIFIAELVWSYLADMSIVKTVARKKWSATLYDLGALAITYGVLATIAKNDWDTWMIIAAICGAATGTFIVASRKPKKKRGIQRKKMPVTTA